MTAPGELWTPDDPVVWGRALGLAYVPLFGATRERPTEWPGDCAALLDGQRSSFAVCSIYERGREYDRAPVAWSWSANLNHTVIIDNANGLLFLRRWDSPDTVRRFRLPVHPQGAEDLVSVLEGAALPACGDVILRMLSAFRRLRSVVPDADSLDSIRVFNALLAGTQAARMGGIDEHGWLRCRTVRDTISHLPKSAQEATGVGNVRASTLEAIIEDVLGCFVAPDPGSGFRLEPDLLIRHAAGQLYQEAHLQIERDDLQLRLPGFSTDASPYGVTSRDVRFTPATLARALAKRVLDAVGEAGSRRLDILDPACGSGIFLESAVRELEMRGFRGAVVLRGFDVSPVSCAMATFCLEDAKRDAEASGIQVTIDVRTANALEEPWGTPDAVLMNPPFVRWDGMDRSDRELVSGALGHLTVGRPDKAMAFVWKGVEALRPGAVLASLLPASLFESAAGQLWRDALADRTERLLLGRFRGFSYFSGSAVEPGFVVLKRRGEEATPQRQSVEIILADEGSEEHAIRNLRRYTHVSDMVSGPGWCMFGASPESRGPAGWVPLHGEYLWLWDRLSALGVPRVKDLFTVRQGMRTGRKSAFVLDASSLEFLPRSERRFFRPAASSPTIAKGQLIRRVFAFFPFDKSGLLLRTERDLLDAVPEYHARYLQPALPHLVARAGIDPARWWVPVWERSWQWALTPKLVSKDFGEQGSFAFDETGEYVVLGGHNWEWRGVGLGLAPFVESPLVWAYLALLNSPLFESVLSCCCPRVRGGQYKLARQFVGRALLPNLADEANVSPHDTRSLAQAGRQIHEGIGVDGEQLGGLAARAYGITPNEARRLRDLRL